MVYAIILAGGTGTRLGGDIPKQYLKVSDKPVISYCLEKFEKHTLVDFIIIVVSDKWQKLVTDIIKKENISKFIGFAFSGSSRQHSILNGLEKAYNSGIADSDIVIIHDAARPNVSENLISSCIHEIKDVDAVMPVIQVKDTIYLSKTGKTIDSLLNRNQLFAGQAPESFIFGKYYTIHKNFTEKELANIKGSTEIAYKNNLNIKIIEGEESNYKITTISDLNKFELEIKKREGV